MPIPPELRGLLIADEIPVFSPDRPPALRLIRLTSWSVTIVVGVLQTWGARFSPSPDAANYLDIAGAILRGDWKNVVNAYWSPLYPGLLALCLRVFTPAPSWESRFLQILNLAGLLVALACFEYFFRCFIKKNKQTRASLGEMEPLSEATWWMLGYGLFLSTAFFVQTVTPTTPDVWVSALTFIAAGIVLKIRMESGGWRLFAQLGLVLGGAFTRTFCQFSRMVLP
jgi:hypothetical protein